MDGCTLMGSFTPLINAANGPPMRAPLKPLASPNLGSFSRPIWPLYVMFNRSLQGKDGKIISALFVA